VKFWLLTPTQNQVLRLAMLEDYFEEEEEEDKEQQQEQQQQALAEVAIANTGQQDQPNALPSVFYSWPEKGQCTSAPDVTWACVW